jgi:hypothetical protein
MINQQNWSSSQVGPLARTALNFAQVGLTGNSSFFPAGKVSEGRNILTGRRQNLQDLSD